MKLENSLKIRSLRHWAGSIGLALSLFAASTVWTPAETFYITPGRPDGIALLAPPPARGSEEEAADLATARSVFNARTKDESARAKKDSTLSIFNFAPAIGPDFKPGKFPKTEKLFEKVKTDISDVINTPKYHWKRLRPYQIETNLTFGPPEASPSYPSGHSTRGTVQSLILVELFPDQSAAILDFGREIGWDRVLIGKHFPTDVQAGRVLGKAIVRELMASPAFQHDLAEAKAEIEAARHEPAAP